MALPVRAARSVWLRCNTGTASGRYTDRRTSAQGRHGVEPQGFPLRGRPDEWKTAFGQTVREGELGHEHRFGDGPPRGIRRIEEAAGRREGRALAFDARRKELAARGVQSGNRAALRQHPTPGEP